MLQTTIKAQEASLRTMTNDRDRLERSVSVLKEQLQQAQKSESQKVKDCKRRIEELETQTEQERSKMARMVEWEDLFVPVTGQSMTAITDEETIAHPWDASDVFRTACVRTFPDVRRATS